MKRGKKAFSLDRDTYQDLTACLDCNFTARRTAASHNDKLQLSTDVVVYLTGHSNIGTRNKKQETRLLEPYDLPSPASSSYAYPAHPTCAPTSHHRSSFRPSDWDGDLTYGELDSLATRLAHQLVGAGVRPHDVIPLCFEKSMWTTVAVLAVLKAGGVICMLEPTHPESRLRTIVQQVNATMILSSTSYLSLSSRLAAQAITVGPGSIVAHDSTHYTDPLPAPDPSSLMYVVFTSGSTGTPKGALVAHAAFC